MRLLDDRFRTTASAGSAIGDCVRGPKRADKASHEGLAWAEVIAGKTAHINSATIPGVVYMLGPHAGDLIAEAAAAMEFGASAGDLMHVCHAHPILSESLGEATMAAWDRAFHLPARRSRNALS